MNESINNALPYCVVIPAGGVGSRFSAAALSNENSASDIQPLPKQLRLLAGKTILEHSVFAFINDEDCKAIVVSALASHCEQIEGLFKYEQKVTVIEGGSSRAESVVLGLKKLTADVSDIEWVMVHDAVRPNLRGQDVENLKKAIIDQVQRESNRPFGAILATTSQETIKQARLIQHNAIIHKTLDRSIIWQAKTPQVFRLNELLNALEKVMTLSNIANKITDESTAMERFGTEVLLVQGRRDNIKLTEQSDWHLLEFVLKQK